MDQNLRLFIAIELPSEVQETLSTTAHKLATQMLRVQWANPRGSHLTLKFLGATAPDQVAAITASMHAATHHVRSFTLATTTVGVFPNQRQPRVIWLGIDGDLERLRHLQQRVEQHIAPLGFPTEERAFSPHLTLGRSAKDATPQDRTVIAQAIRAAVAPQPCRWQVTSISLMRSELHRDGARYTRMAEAPLEAKHV